MIQIGEERLRRLCLGLIKVITLASNCSKMIGVMYISHICWCSYRKQGVQINHAMFYCNILFVVNMGLIILPFLTECTLKNGK